MRREEKRGRARYVRGLFDNIASRYDLANAVITLGQIKRWRRRLVDDLSIAGSPLVLDLATGTADVALEILRRSPTARIIGIDLSLEMVRRGREKARRAGFGDRVSFLLADATALPFKEAIADRISDAFLLRHIPSLPDAFAEFRRVLRPGGRIASLELTQPMLPVYKQVFGFLFRTVIPVLGGLIAGDYEAFRYLPRSWRPYPGREELASIMRQTGYEDVRWRLIWLGAVAVHSGSKPA
jgi:demethylmenaquinone methyltransferase/2-methoxy-6-polyprenyl-1,4-benzoquinol methylase